MAEPEDNANQDEIPPGFKLRRMLRGHEGTINRIAWSLVVLRVVVAGLIVIHGVARLALGVCG